MTLVLDISRAEGQDTQVSCTLGGSPLMEFYGFGVDFTDEQIIQSVRDDLSGKGYDLSEP